MITHKISPEWLNRPINVVLVGVGGTGSEMLDELYRIHSLLKALGGAGLNLVAYDQDEVSEANIGRQRFWPCDVGFNKAEVLINRINSFGGTDWGFFDTAFKAKQVGVKMSGNVDLLVTCVDSAKTRASIGKKASKTSGISREIFWLDCGNDAYDGNVILGHLFERLEGLTIPNVYTLYPSLLSMEDDDTPSCSTQEALTKQDYGINRSIAREGANLVWQFLRHGKINHHGSYVDIQRGTTNPLPIDEKVWASFVSGL